MEYVNMKEKSLVSKLFAVLLADHSTHLADGLHGADQVLHDVHIINTSRMWKRGLSVDMLQQCAVRSNGLLDLFFRGFAHKSKTSVSRCKLLKL